VQRVVVLGRGGAGKSTAAERLGVLTGLPVVELDRHFWNSDLTPMPAREWIQVQEGLAARPRWIMDGDLGQYDVLSPRLVAADTVLVLDFSLVRCIWRAARRSRERADFWWWVLWWRYRSRPALLQAVATYAPTADLRILRHPRALQRLCAQIEAASPDRRT